MHCKKLHSRAAVPTNLVCSRQNLMCSLPRESPPPAFSYLNCFPPPFHYILLYSTLNHTPLYCFAFPCSGLWIFLYLSESYLNCFPTAFHTTYYTSLYSILFWIRLLCTVLQSSVLDSGFFCTLVNLTYGIEFCTEQTNMTLYWLLKLHHPPPLTSGYSMIMAFSVLDCAVIHINAPPI